MSCPSADDELRPISTAVDTMAERLVLTVYCCLLLVRTVAAIPRRLPCVDCSSNSTSGKGGFADSMHYFALDFNKSSSTCPSNPAYSQFDIPNSPLALGLSIRHGLKAEAIELCLQSAAAWLNAQPKTATMTGPGFSWKDVAGAEFYIAHADGTLIWQDVVDVVRGLKIWELGSAMRRPVEKEVSYSVIKKLSGTAIGQGYLVRYEHPPPPPDVGASPQISHVSVSRR